MENDLISRSALLEKTQLRVPTHDYATAVINQCVGMARRHILEAPSVDAVVMPEGKPGDYLEWENGLGHRQIYAINSIMIFENCMRYELADFAPVVDHKNIVRIMSRDEAEKVAKKMWTQSLEVLNPYEALFGRGYDG